MDENVKNDSNKIKENPFDECDSIKAEDTVEDTYAKRNSINFNGCIDIEGAKWQESYAKSLDDNMKRLTDCGLIDCMKEIGILYDEKQFKRNYCFVNNNQYENNSVSKDEYDNLKFSDVQT